MNEDFEDCSFNNGYYKPSSRVRLADVDDHAVSLANTFLMVELCMMMINP